MSIFLRFHRISYLTSRRNPMEVFIYLLRFLSFILFVNRHCMIDSLNGNLIPYPMAMPIDDDSSTITRFEIPLSIRPPWQGR